ncbi:hypothetical protein MHOCP_06000 [Moorella humiferrea]|uniref:SDH family Clp fold serine proteinase n=1 Tax=Neomoorella humiferrea TaxID=676965 RepID=UPI0030CC5733
MGRAERLPLLQQIEAERQSAVICYFTGDRENLGTRIAPDVIRVFYRHLLTLGPRPRIDLFLYTRGGDVLTPWRLVNLVREFTHHLGVLVPFRAASAGTLLCLGANEIVMGALGELGPIDPSVANAFNPEDPANPIARLPVSVEDVMAYFSLARETAGLESEDSLAAVFNRLVDKVHPLALGNVHRNYALIRSLARKLLELHMPAEEDGRVTEIIKNLTERLYAHNHMISRREALQEIKLHVTTPSARLEELMWQLYLDYEADLKLLEPFNPVALLKPQEYSVDFEATGGIIESIPCLDAFIFNGTITRESQPREGAPPVNVTFTRQGWRQLI